MTTVTDSPRATRGSVRRTNRSQSIIVAFLAAALVILGGWLIFMETSGTSVPDDVNAAIDDYAEAWENTDETALRAVTTPNFVLNEFIYTQGQDLANPDKVTLSRHLEADVDEIVNVAFEADWVVERFADAAVSGDGPWFVSMSENWIEDNYLLEGTASYVVVDDEGTLRIANHFWAGIRRWADLEEAG